MRSLFNCILSVLMALSVGCGGVKEFPSSAQAETVHAKIESATLTVVPSEREAVGTIRSATTSAIQSKTVGHVTAIHVKAGDLVETGALLAEIDSRDADAQLKSAESGLRAAERALEEATQALAAAKSAVQAADAQSVLARTSFDRQSRLLAEKAISKQTFDEADAAAKSAEAEARMRAEEVAAVLARREQAEAAVEQARAALDAAKVGVSYKRVTAPFAGIVASKSVDVGDLASPGMTLFTLEDRQTYRLETSVDESMIGAIRVNDSVSVVIDGSPEGAIDGTVSEIVPAADATSRTSMVKISLPPNDALRSGQFGRARFASGNAQQIVIPRSALVVRGQLEGVFALDADGIARLRLVKTGRWTADTVEVLSGLSEGDRYVAEVTPDVVDGVRVAAQ